VGRIESDPLKSQHMDLAIPSLSSEQICWHCGVPESRKTNNLRHRYTFGIKQRIPAQRVDETDV